MRAVQLLYHSKNKPTSNLQRLLHFDANWHHCTSLELEIDTGAAVSIVSEATCKGKLNKPTIQPCLLVLKGYPDKKLALWDVVMLK